MNESHQIDAERWDQLMAEQDARDNKKIRKAYGYSNQEDTIDKMDRSSGLSFLHAVCRAD